MASHCPFCDNLTGATSARNVRNASLAEEVKQLTQSNTKLLQDTLKLQDQVDWMTLCNSTATRKIQDLEQILKANRAIINRLQNEKQKLDILLMTQDTLPPDSHST